ncbi:MAG: CTP synthase [Pseudomonadota bacterium]
MAPRFLFITGGVVSSLGKGLAASTIGTLLKSRGFKVRLRKLDPYLNIDPGTMSPHEHGEVFVTDDGAETDLDLGHYERFTDQPAARGDNVTAGQLYLDILNRERQGDFGGKTVQVIPHVTDAIKASVTNNLVDEDFVVCEIGGTVGDIESLPFLEAIRQFSNQSPARCMFIHVTLVPQLRTTKEIKTKPTQHSVKELLSAGIQPAILLCRGEDPLADSAREKISLFCNIPMARVISAPDIDIIYEAPAIYHQGGLDDEILSYFGIKNAPAPDLRAWQKVVDIMRHPEDEVVIGVVGKYLDNLDSYKSLDEALTHGGIANHVRIKRRWIDAQKLCEDNGERLLDALDGVLVPGGFGERGAQGKTRAITWARTQRVPCFGICFGMQLAVIETARQLAGLTHANSDEFGESESAIVGYLSSWVKNGRKITRKQNAQIGGTMRLGSYPATLDKNSRVFDIYGTETINERHRHRYEINLRYIDDLARAGMQVTGRSPDGQLPEIVERPDHPWFIGVQFHPELKSRPLAPHPLFISFIAAAIEHRRLV